MIEAVLLLALQDPTPEPARASATPAAIETRLARAIGAVSPEEIERTVRELVAFGTRHVLSATDDPGRGTGAARDYLERRYRELIRLSGGRLRVDRQTDKVSAQRLREPELEVVNIVATLPGTTDPDRVYVVGGHYDSRNSTGSDGKGDAPGANDDGSGTAVALEACRVLCREKFAATIMFVAYDGEEQGLLGSKAHAEALAATDLKVDGMITNDIVGNTLGMDGVTRDDYLRCFSYAPRGNDSLGRSLARAAARAARLVDGVDIKLVFRGDRYGRGGDHRPFFQEGVPAVRFTEPREDYSRQHQNVTERDGKPYGDLPEYMDFDYAARVARLNVAVLGELAAAPAPPLNVRVRGARDRYATTVSWLAVEGVATYEVVWRDTTAADWESARVFGEGGSEIGSRRRSLTATLDDVCIDDVVVGVRCVGTDGSRSRVVTPSEPDAMAMRGR